MIDGNKKHVTTNAMQRTGIRKAAILVASLDRFAADRLLDQLSPECADLVRQAAMHIDMADMGERRRVLEEFRRAGMLLPDPYPPGIELDDSVTIELGRTSTALSPCDWSALAEKLIDLPPRPRSMADATPNSQNSSENTKPFGFLRNIESSRLLQLLDGERPQTVALVLSHLPPSQAAEVLSQFIPSRQVEIVRRLVALENTDAELLLEIEQTIEARWLRLSALEPKRIGPETAAKIFAACDCRTANVILDNLAAYDKPLAEQFTRRRTA
jgi:flagellar motor switch protein FliG